VYTCIYAYKYVYTNVCVCVCVCIWVELVAVMSSGEFVFASLEYGSAAYQTLFSGTWARELELCGVRYRYRVCCLV